MRTAYIANIGTQDVLRGGDSAKEARADGEAWLREYDAAWLSAPILEKGIAHVLREAGRIDRIVLFATDQPLSSPDSERKKDTFAFGKILERLLPEKLGPTLGEVRCCPVPQNPADYDAMLRFFAETLPAEVPPGDFGSVWIAPVGGAPAATTGLLLNAVRLYRRGCQAIYVPRMAAPTVQVLEIHQHILADFAREEAKAHLASRDFGALQRTLDQADLGARWLRPLCAYADARLRFDFDGANAALDEAQRMANGGQVKGWVERCRRSLAPLVDGVSLAQPDSSVTDAAHWDAWLNRQRASLAELYFNLRVTVLRGAWVDFLGRLFRLNEAALRLVFEHHTRHSTEKKDGGFGDFVKAIQADQEVLARFTEKKIDCEAPDGRNLLLWLDLQVKREGKTFGPLRTCFQQVDRLRNLRNKSILAHGYQGVAREGVEAELKGTTVGDFVDRDLRDLLTRLGAKVTVDDDPLRDVVSWLEEI